MSVRQIALQARSEEEQAEAMLMAETAERVTAWVSASTPLGRWFPGQRWSFAQSTPNAQQVEHPNPDEVPMTELAVFTWIVEPFDDLAIRFRVSEKFVWIWSSSGWSQVESPADIGKVLKGRPRG